MTESEWLACADPTKMLGFLTSPGTFPIMSSRPPKARKLCLFACACRRACWHLLTDERSRLAVETVERYADGLATKAELDAAAWSGAAAAWSAAAAARKKQAALLRCIFGNPWRPVKLPESRHWYPGPPWEQWFDCPWLTWNDGAVRKMAAAIYEERVFDRMPLLADALEDASCADVDILSHCRQVPTGRTVAEVLEMRKNAVAGGCCNRFADYLSCDCLEEARRQPPLHCRGCFVLDTILGKE